MTGRADIANRSKWSIAMKQITPLASERKGAGAPTAPSAFTLRAPVETHLAMGWKLSDEPHCSGAPMLPPKAREQKIQILR